MISKLPPNSAGLSTTRPQFSLGALFGYFVAIALTLAYLRTFDSVEVFVSGLILLCISVVVGEVTGGLVKRRAETCFWSIIVTTAAYLSVVGETRYGIMFHIAWSMVGATSGALAAAVPPGRLSARMAAGCLGGSVPMLIYYACISGRIGPGLEFDVLAATIVGALVGLLIEIIAWVERRSRIPRYVTATWLLCAVIVGNLMVPWVMS